MRNLALLVLMAICFAVIASVTLIAIKGDRNDNLYTKTERLSLKTGPGTAQADPGSPLAENLAEGNGRSSSLLRGQ